jgi:molybdate transport system regulatory protein
MARATSRASSRALSRYPGLTLRILGRRAPAMGPGKAALLEGIDKTGSISAAARSMDMSYRRAWQLVQAINESFAEPLVEKATGGRSGGGASLTPFGRTVVERYRRMEAKASGAIAGDVESFSALLKGGARS